MALVGVELETLVFEPDAQTTRPPPCAHFFFFLICWLLLVLLFLRLIPNCSDDNFTSTVSP